MRSLRVLLILAIVSAAALPATERFARAEGPGTQKPGLGEVREMRQFVESKHQQRLREIQEGLAANTYDSDTAILLRMKADQEYKNRVESLRQDELEAIQASNAKPGPGDPAGRAPTNAAVPRFQSQSVITYPQDDAKPAPEEKPQREGSQKNVGFGTRELEF